MMKVTVLIAILCVVAVVLLEAAPPRGPGGGNNAGQNRNGGGRSRNRGSNRGRKTRTTTTTTTTTTPPPPPEQSSGQMRTAVVTSLAGGMGMAGGGEVIREGIDAIRGTDSDNYADKDVAPQNNAPAATIQYTKGDRSLTFEGNGMAVFVSVIGVVLVGLVGYCLYNQRKSSKRLAAAIDMRTRYGRSN